MNRFGEEVRVIPRAAWWIAGLLSGGIIAACLGFALNEHVEALFFTVFGVFLFPYILLLGYIAGDARRRGMSAVLWVLLAMFIPSMIGFILYFLLRSPIARDCPKCGARTNATFPYCPVCGTALAPACPSCQTAVEPGWSHCARCGAALSRTA